MFIPEFYDEDKPSIYFDQDLNIRHPQEINEGVYDVKKGRDSLSRTLTLLLYQLWWSTLKKSLDYCKKVIQECIQNSLQTHIKKDTINTMLRRMDLEIEKKERELDSSFDKLMNIIEN